MEGGAAAGVASSGRSDAVKAAGVKETGEAEENAGGSNSAKAGRKKYDAPAASLPEHCDEPGAGDGTLAHTGKDYFCCNRAVGEAELAAVAHGSMRDFIATGGRFPVMVVTYDRASTLDRTLESLLQVRCVTPGDVHVVQDGSVAAVSEVIKKRGVQHHMKADGDNQNFRGGKPMDGAGRIAQHFRYALSYMFRSGAPTAPAVIVAEDDFLFSPDWYEYFHAVAPALEADPSLWIASAWNDNGFDYLVADPYALKRTRFFPGLGWLLPRRLWEGELASSWPDSHWDHWMRDPARHKGRDVLIPEVPRDYHAGVKGTFMDSGTHNRYFGSIAMQASGSFTWDTPEGADAIARVMQPAWEARLRDLLKDPATEHLADVPSIAAFGGAGRVGVVWYSAVPGMHNHESMRPVAAFFGVWHEGGRGSWAGIHDIWWVAGARLLLINACDGHTVGTGGGQYVTGTIECTPVDLRAYMPAGHAPIPSAQFEQHAALKPRLHRHAQLFGATLSAPMAHLDGGADANGPPDAADDEAKAIAAAEAGGKAKAADSGKGKDKGGHDHADGGSHPHPHTRFMGDLVLPAARAVGAAGAGGAGGGGALLANGVQLPSSVHVVRSTVPGAHCSDVCKAYRPGAVCSASHLPALNSCAVIGSYYDCDKCDSSVGADQPALISRSAPGDKGPGRCLVNSDPGLFSCQGTFKYALRLCPCAMP